MTSGRGDGAVTVGGLVSVGGVVSGAAVPASWTNLAVP